MTTPFALRATAVEVLDGITLVGHRAVATGGTSGIGADGAEVTVATRRPETAGSLIRELAGIPGAVPVHAQALELSDLSSVRNVAKQWQGPWTSSSATRESWHCRIGSPALKDGRCNWPPITWGTLRSPLLSCRRCGRPALHGL